MSGVSHRRLQSEKRYSPEGMTSVDHHSPGSTSLT